MAEVSRIWTVGGKRPLSPVFVADECDRSGWPMEWHGLVNGVRVPRGLRHGEANFLLSNEDLDSLDLTTEIDIECEHEDGTTKWPGWYVIKTQLATRDQDNPAHWVTLADRRYVYDRIAANTRYNLRTGPDDSWVESSLLAGSPYTWQDIIDDLWSLLPDTAGTVPTIPPWYFGETTPENLDFEGLTVWRSICQVLTAIGCAAVYDPLTEKFSIVRLIDTQTGLSTLRDDNDDRILWNFRPESLVEVNYPKEVSVSFQKVPGAGESPWLEAADVETVLVDPLGLEDAKWPILDTMFSWDDNSAERTERANEIADALKGLLKPVAEPWGEVYSGVIEFVCGEDVTEVEWISDGSRGMQTVVRHSYVEIDWPKLPTIFGGTGGGGTRIRFRIVDVVCYGDSLLYVVAEWTHYTGGCNQDPPGADSYTGEVHIYDSCIFSYYTFDFLLNGTDGNGATGSATYFFPRDSYQCEGMWIVDSVCGQPECQ